MMLDWYVLVTPLLLLPIVSLFVFVGCALEHAVLSPRPDILLTWNPSQLDRAHVALLRVEFGISLPSSTLPNIVRESEGPPTSGRFEYDLGTITPAQEGMWTVVCKAWYMRMGTAEVQAEPRMGLSVSAMATSSVRPRFIFSLGADTPSDLAATNFTVIGH
jgi:hypothetical protein